MSDKSWKDYTHYCLKQKRQPHASFNFLAEYYYPSGHHLVGRRKSSNDFDTIVQHTQDHLLTGHVGDVHINFAPVVSQEELQQSSVSITVFVNDLADTIQDLLSLFGYTGGYSPTRLAKALLNQADPIYVSVADVIDFKYIDMRDMLTILLVLYLSGIETTIIFDDTLYEDPFDDK